MYMYVVRSYTIVRKVVVIRDSKIIKNPPEGIYIMKDSHRVQTEEVRHLGVNQMPGYSSNICSVAPVQVEGYHR